MENHLQQIETTNTFNNSKEGFQGFENSRYPKTMTNSNTNFSQSYDRFGQRRQILQDHFIKLLDKNTKYLETVGEYTWGKNKQQQKSLVLDYKKGGESTYQKDFIKPAAPDNKIDKEYYYMQYYNKQPMELSTTNRVDFIKHSTSVPNFEKGKNISKFLPFAGVSSYKQSFINYPSNPTSCLKPPSHPTVIKDLPFIGNSIYKDDFKGTLAEFDPERERIIKQNKRGQFKSPINPDIPFLGQTSNQFAYKSYKSQKQQSLKSIGKYDPLPSFDGQFVSTFKNDYNSKLEKQNSANSQNKHTLTAVKN